MPSRDFMIEVFVDSEDSWSYGCPEYDLYGYTSIDELIVDISIQRNIYSQQTSRQLGDEGHNLQGSHTSHDAVLLPADNTQIKGGKEKGNGENVTLSV